MLATADILHDVGSKEWRDARDEIRNDFKIEKDTGIINNNYKIDSSGSVPSAPTGTVKPGNGQGNNNQGNIGSTQHGSSGMTKSQHSAFRN